MDPFLTAVGLIGDRNLTDDVLAEVMEILGRISSLENHDLDQVRRRLEATIGISMMTGEGLHGGDQAPWLEAAKANITWNYWDSYVQLMKGNGFGKTVIRTLDEDTDNILNECGNPADETPWRIQGLVMGDVQSGKTANYCGLITKAADSGYKIIVLLTGMIEELRAQSQERLDEGFVGRDSRKLIDGKIDQNKIGAGRFRTMIPNVLTSIDSDFLTANKKALGGIPLENIREPVLLVMKKNSSALKNLDAFLRTQIRSGSAKLDVPLLLVDDEADNASVNAKKDDAPAVINGLIRTLLDRFGRATYVGYTATPFANVFINPDRNDLFPSNFVYSLNSPSSYIGSAAMFLESGEQGHQLVDILDAEKSLPEKHTKNLEISDIPDSMQEAIDAFLLSCAIRDIRKEPLRHRSMLINVTRFTDVQARLSTHLKEHLYGVVEEVKQYLADDELWARHQPLVRLHTVFLEHYGSCGVEWKDVRRQMHESIASVKVVTVNQKSDETDRLNYGAYKNTEKGRRVIAVGGLTLSRGLTLEGLCTSYFRRNSKAYDTLLQMGRWFGYRSAYADLCRVWMEPEVQGWFSHIAKVVQELRLDIRRMHANKQPPSRFGMRVLSHPDVLMVTAANKMRNAEEITIHVSFSGYGAETPFLPSSKEVNDENLRLLGRLADELGQAVPIGSRLSWSGVPASTVASFLASLTISPMNMAFVPEEPGSEPPITKFLRENSIGELATWDVCLAQGDGDAIETLKVHKASGGLVSVRPRLRQFEKTRSIGGDYLKLNKQRVGEISDERVGLTEDEIATAERDWRGSDEERVKKAVPGSAYRAVRTRPLLTLHVIEPTNPPEWTDKNKKRIVDCAEIKPTALVAVGISLPRFENEDAAKVPYRLNKVALRNLGLIEEEDADEDED